MRGGWVGCLGIINLIAYGHFMLERRLFTLMLLDQDMKYKRIFAQYSSIASLHTKSTSLYVPSNDQTPL